MGGQVVVEVYFLWFLFHGKGMTNANHSYD